MAEQATPTATVITWKEFQADPAKHVERVQQSGETLFVTHFGRFMFMVGPLPDNFEGRLLAEYFRESGIDPNASSGSSLSTDEVERLL